MGSDKIEGFILLVFELGANKGDEAFRFRVGLYLERKVAVGLWATFFGENVAVFAINTWRHSNALFFRFLNDVLQSLPMYFQSFGRRDFLTPIEGSRVVSVVVFDRWGGHTAPE